MAEQKGGADDGEESHGEFVGLRNVDDSGIESGEDFRAVNPEVMREVEDALGKLEGVILGLDPSRRVAVTQLMSSLQSCLRIPPKRRQTIGVSPKELASARKWFVPPLEELTLEHVNFSPVAQRVGYFMEPAPQNAVLSYAEKTERSLSGDSGSLQDYDPSLMLFTPEQTVQIAIHKAAINKQISQEEKRRESSDDGDVSSGDEENSEVNKYSEVSSAQRLLQLATESAKKNPSAARFHNRSSRKLKMKRANTIDIPKPANFYEYSSGDEYGASADEVNNGYEKRRPSRETFLPPSFVPKTENDLKFLAFLKQVNDNQPKVQSYNPSARGGKHWSNRFSSIKTAFENVEQKPPSAAPSPAKMFWQNTEAGRSKSSRDQPSKLPWTVKTENDGVVVGSLTVAKPGHVNNFNHAPKSAFKPIEKKPTSTVSGTVKQIAAQKFSVANDEFIKSSEKLSKNTSTSNTHSNELLFQKQNGSYSAFKQYQPTNAALKNKYSEPVHSVHSSYLTNSHQYNGSQNTQNKHYSSQNKSVSSNVTSKSNISNYQSNNNNNYDYLSKSQQNTMAAKKQFLESSEIKAQREDIQSRNSYYIDRATIGNTAQGIPNGASRAQHYKNNVHSQDYEQKNSQCPLDYSPSNKNNPSESFSSKYSNTNIVHPKPIPREKPKTNFTNSGSSAQGIEMSKNSFSQNMDPYPGADIVEPIIIPKELRNSHTLDSKKDQNYTNSNVVERSHTNNNSLYSNLHTSDSHSPVVACMKPSYENRPSDIHISSQFSIQPSPPLRRDSLPKHFQNPEFSNKSYSDQFSSINNYRGNGTSYDDYSDSNIKQYPQDSSDRLTESSYLSSTNHDKKPFTTYIYSSNNTLNSSSPQEPFTDLNSYTNQSNYLLPNIVSTPPLVRTEPQASPSNLPPSSASIDRLSPNKQFSVNKTQMDPRYLSPSYHAISPSHRHEDDESPWGSVTNGDDSPLEEKAVSKVMGQAQCQQAVTVNSRTKRRFDLDLESELKLQLKQSAQKKSLSPSFPNVIQKSESWHQMVKEQMQQAKQAPPLPKISKAKSSHSLAQPKQFEAALPPDSVTQKKMTVSQYLAKQQSRSVKSTKSNPKYKSTNTLYIQNDDDDDDLDNVDEVFESIFQETTRKRNSK